MNNQKIKIERSLLNLDKFISQNGWAGYDPYDIKGLKIILKIIELGNRFFLVEVFREIIFEFIQYFPIFFRKILFIKPQTNAKAMGLFATSYLDLYKHYNEEQYLQKTNECLSWLDENYTDKFGGKGWGYPFGWQSKKFIPNQTPNGIVTTAVAEAYWQLYKTKNDFKYLETCKDICVFLVKLPIDNISENQICFSYTPLYINHVHNLNLFVAEFLIKVGLETNNQEWIKLGTFATNYTIANQLNDGSFDYNGPPEKPQNFVDHYHTGFVIRKLHDIWKLTKDENYFNALEKCYNHYINNFFIDFTIPKYTPTRKYRIDIHSCSEAINCLSELNSIFPQGKAIALNVANWTIDNLQDKSGYFYHGLFKSRILPIEYRSKIPHIRWGQAWMLKAFSNLLKII